MASILEMDECVTAVWGTQVEGTGMRPREGFIAGAAVSGSLSSEQGVCIHWPVGSCTPGHLRSKSQG